VVQAKFRELTIVRKKSKIQEEQNNAAGKYLDKLKLRIDDLEKSKKSDPLGHRFIALGKRFLRR
jgi:hypothetical protein